MPTVRSTTTAEVPAALLAEIRHLLVEAFEGGLSDDDWDHTLGGWHVVVLDGGSVRAHAAVVPRAFEVAGLALRVGYVEGVATAADRQGEGLGGLAMTEATDLVRREFAMGALSTGRHRFYERLGWERWRGPTFAGHGPGAVRTEEEDDGVMVLRFGPSSGVDLGAAIACDARAGDDW